MQRARTLGAAGILCCLAALLARADGQPPHTLTPDKRLAEIQRQLARPVPAALAGKLDRVRLRLEQLALMEEVGNPGGPAAAALAARKDARAVVDRLAAMRAKAGAAWPLDGQFLSLRARLAYVHRLPKGKARTKARKDLFEAFEVYCWNNEHDPSAYHVYRMLGDLYLTQAKEAAFKNDDDFEEAEAAYKAAIAIPVKYADVRLLAYAAYLDACRAFRRFDTAKTLAAAMRKEYPKLAGRLSGQRALMAEARLLAAQGKQVAARTLLTTIARTSPRLAAKARQALRALK